MSHLQFGTAHPTPTTPLASSPLLMTGSTAAPPTSGSSSSCCENGRPIMTDPHTGQTICSCQYPSSLLSAAYPRVPGITDSMYTSAYAAQGYVPISADPTAFYPQLGAASHTAAYYPYDPAFMGYAYANGYGADFNPAHRKNATREATNTLKAWLQEHIKNPYPTKGEKIMLAIITKMTLTQVSTWFANARRRLKKENKMTWTPKNRSEDDDDEDKSDISDDDRDGGKDGLDDKLGDEDIDIEGTGLNDSDSFKDLTLPLPKKDSPMKTLISPAATSTDGRSPSPGSDRIPPLPSSTKEPTSTVTSPSPIKPKIWSLADIATSGTSSSSGTTPSAPPSITSSAHPGLSNLSQARGAFSLGPTSQSLYGPSALNNLRQWVNGTYHGAGAPHPSSAFTSQAALSGLMRPTVQSVIPASFGTHSTPAVTLPRLGLPGMTSAGIPLSSSSLAASKEATKVHNG